MSYIHYRETHRIKEGSEEDQMAWHVWQQAMRAAHSVVISGKSQDEMVEAVNVLRNWGRLNPPAGPSPQPPTAPAVAMANQLSSSPGCIQSLVLRHLEAVIEAIADGKITRADAKAGGWPMTYSILALGASVPPV